MSYKCGDHKDRRKRLYGRIFKGVFITVIIVLVVFFIIWAILQPKKPRFVLQDATIFTLNVSAPNVVTTKMQITVFIRNPNDKIGVYYDNLRTYGTYRDQQITLEYIIPPFYQGQKENTIWSPFLEGQNVPVAPYNGILLGEDQSSGQVELVIKFYGRVRFKVGAFTSAHYRLNVNCPAIIAFGNRNAGIYVGNAIKYQLSQSCSVSL